MPKHTTVNIWELGGLLKREFTVLMPSCCEGNCNCKTPFYIYPPGISPEDGHQVGKIIQHWRGRRWNAEVLLLMPTKLRCHIAEYKIILSKAGKLDPLSPLEKEFHIMDKSLFINILFFETTNK